MDTLPNVNENFRYPGSRPFYDNDIDRRLFFGREQEKNDLLHKVLADKLVVVYARSGMGKTSLINAGLNQALRDKGFIPLMIRLNTPGLDPIEAIYEGIDEIVKSNSQDYVEGKKDSLWEYFKTVRFWSQDDTLLKPVLILDQFEEFFDAHSVESRNAFIRQLGDVVNNKVPDGMRRWVQSGESFIYSDKPPNVKIVISMREDFLGQLEEMSRDIPDIFTNRFKLLPLSRNQAKAAITEPAQLQDETIGAGSFGYSPEAVDMMLDFLCKRKEKGGIKITDEVESFQLQLLCRHIEDKIRERESKGNTNIVVEPEDLGGEQGMQQVLQRFYDDLLKRLGSYWKKRRSRRLCEKGLINAAGRRLSLEEDEIKRKYGVSERLLAQLVGYRLLRSEPRVGSIYYELSHDTLITPIRESQKRRSSKRNSIFGFIGICVFIGILFIFNYINIKNRVHNLCNEGKDLLDEGRYEDAIKKFRKVIEINKNYVTAHLELGRIYYTLGKMGDAKIQFQKAILLDPKCAGAYEGLGEIAANNNDYKSAIINKYETALKINPQNPEIYKKLALIYIKFNEPKNSIDIYRRALKANENYADLYYDISEALKRSQNDDYLKILYDIAQKSGSKNAHFYFLLGTYYEDIENTDKAIESYQKAVELDPSYTYAYNNWGIVLESKAKFEESINLFKKAIQIDPNFVYAYNNMGVIYIYLKDYAKASEAFKKAIEIDPHYKNSFYNLGNALANQKKFDEAIKIYEKALHLDPRSAMIHNSIGLVFSEQKEYEKALKNFDKALEIDPGYILAKENIAEISFLVKDFEKSFKMAQDLLKDKNLSVDSNFAMRFISISALVCQGKKIEARKQLKQFFSYYKSVSEDYVNNWNYDTIREFINGNRMPISKDKQFLLKLIDFLSSSNKIERDKKLKDLILR
ncbi:MAG: tetratricopeptide repeat protein [Candidatus Omnitrophota bacterium]